MMVNNEVGSVMPIAQMAKLTHRMCPEAVFHTDAVQGFLKVPFAAKTLGADLISVSSHKVHGPKGVGALYISPRLKSFPALLMGGGQEGNYRSGTEGTPAIFSFAAACTVMAATYKEDAKTEQALIGELAEKLTALEGVRINGSHEAPHVLSIAIPGVPTQNSINILQDHGICVAAGSACAKVHLSHVLEAMKVAPETIDGSFRISICRHTTREELEKLYTVIWEEILPRAR
jgi:cysteine desulfurase